MALVGPHRPGNSVMTGIDQNRNLVFLMKRGIHVTRTRARALPPTPRPVQQRSGVCVALGGNSSGSLQDVDHWGRPWLARRPINRILARKRGPKARSWSKFHLSSSDFGHRADVRGPDAISRDHGHRAMNTEYPPSPSLHAFFRANFRLFGLRASHGRPP